MTKMNRKRHEITGFILIIIGLASILYGGYYQTLYMMGAGGMFVLIGGVFYVISDLVEDLGD